MVVALGPGKFYGSSLPRPRMMLMNRSAEEEDIYTKARLDPPLGVMDPLSSWAHEAHWSMGGLSFNRLKLQGRIEGNVKKLRSQQKKKLLSIKKSLENSDSKKTTPVRVSDVHHSSSPSSASPSPSPPPAPAATKRRRRLALLLDDDEDVNHIIKSSDPVVEEDDVSGINRSSTRRLFGGESKPKRARKLVDDFDRVASSESESESSPSPIQSSSPTRSSPNTKKNQSITKGGRTISSRTRNARQISPEKESVEEETTPAIVASPSKKVQDLSKKRVLRSKSKANDVANDASKKNSKNKSMVTPSPPAKKVRTSSRLRSSPAI
ncbi:uncharacterized protein LOC113334594 [Papaver somniferum]|uniref:uncharacterized protein LOC113334594 n=1 Tax=Papaver somniferum TaxID=3469 RepID=UPI000E6FBEA8|nr:uncharacterized protein LOC113334594 [Papaver somniferum]